MIGTPLASQVLPLDGPCTRVNSFSDVGHQLQIDFLCLQALFLLFLPCSSSLPPLKLGFELFIFVYFILAHHILFACHYPRDLTDHTTSLHSDLLG